MVAFPDLRCRHRGPKSRNNGIKVLEDDKSKPCPISVNQDALPTKIDENWG